jgi:hypothetical protein
VFLLERRPVSAKGGCSPGEGAAAAAVRVELLTHGVHGERVWGWVGGECSQASARVMWEESTFGRPPLHPTEPTSKVCQVVGRVFVFFSFWIFNF